MSPISLENGEVYKMFSIISGPDSKYIPIIYLENLIALRFQKRLKILYSNF